MKTTSSSDDWAVTVLYLIPWSLLPVFLFLLVLGLEGREEPSLAQNLCCGQHLLLWELIKTPTTLQMSLWSNNMSNEVSYFHNKHYITACWHNISFEVLVRISHLLYCIIFSLSIFTPLFASCMSLPWISVILETAVSCSKISFHSKIH